jgi:RNA polymerase sigma-70 factor, ECF subfamily
MSVNSSAITYSEDDQRMIRLQEGDRSAFDELVLAWQLPLTRFFMRNLRDESWSQDLVQETLLRLYRKSWDYLPTGRFRGWLFRIANNLLIDHSRRVRHDVLMSRVRRWKNDDGEERDPLDTVPAGLVSPAATAMQQELATVVAELLTQLADVQRKTFLLHHYEGLTLTEVADAMDTSLPTTKSRLRLAKDKLRYLLTCRGFSEDAISESE